MLIVHDWSWEIMAGYNMDVANYKHASYKVLTNDLPSLIRVLLLSRATEKYSPYHPIDHESEPW